MPSMAQRMKAWVYHPLADPSENGLAIRLEAVPVPEVGPGEVLVRVVKASVCGTDETLFTGGLSRPPDGIIPGHEFCGEVVEVGAGVEQIGVGHVVAMESHYSLPDGADEGIIGLWPPRDEQRNELKTYHGGYAEYSCFPAECAHRLPPGLAAGSFWPSLFEPAGNDFLLAQEIRDLNPRHVSVFGCGPHGLYAQIFLRHFGVPEIYAFEKDPFRAEFARDLGCATVVFEPGDPAVGPQIRNRTGGRGFDVSVDMVGKSGQAYADCLNLTRDGGTVVLFGLFTSDFEIAGRNANELIFSRGSITIAHQDKSLQIIGITGREGIWPALIESVSASSELQRLLMEPVTIVGELDLLGKYIQEREPEILKAAFYPFK